MKREDKLACCRTSLAVAIEVDEVHKVYGVVQ
jgi:hypothetical protein